MKPAVNPLDPRLGEIIPFRRVGKLWFLGNKPARVASEIVEDGGRVVVIEDGDVGDATVLREPHTQEVS